MTFSNGGGTGEPYVIAIATHRQAPAATADDALALSCLAPGPLLYARLDGVVSDGTNAPEGTFLPMEAELIEPMLFLTHSGRGAELFAEATARRIGALQSVRSTLT